MWRTLFMLALAEGLYFQLPGNSKRCLTESVGPGATITGEFVVSGIAEALVLTRLYDPDGKIAFKNPIGKAEGRFELQSPAGGNYQLCFQAFDRAAKTISFDLQSTVSGLEFASEADLDPLEVTIDEIAKHTDRVLRNLKFFQLRERVHRDLTERTCTNVAWSGLAKVVVLLAVAVTHGVVLGRGFAKSAWTI